MAAANDTSSARRRKILCWSLAVALCLVPVIMLGVIYALGPYGVCEDVGTNDPLMVTVWFLATIAGAILAYPLVVIGGYRIRKRRRNALAVAIALGAAVSIFLIGLIPWINDVDTTACGTLRRLLVV